MTADLSAGGIGILATGSYLPERVVTNDEVVAMVPGTSAEWIERKTKIVSRRFAAPDEAASDLAVRAARSALDAAGLGAGDIDYLIVSTTTGDAPIPATATLVQHALGAHRAGCFDVNIACSGFVTSLALARALISLRPAARALVIGTDVYSRFVDFDDRATSVLFGDGAGAAVVAAVDDGSGFLDLDMIGGGAAHRLIEIPGGGSRRPASPQTVADRGHVLHMRGREVRDYVMDNVPGIIDALLERCDHKAADVDHFVPHQANGMMVTELVDACGLTGAVTHLPLDHSGNTGSASVAIALDEANRSGALRPGDLVLLAGFGAGMAVAAGLLRWSAPVARSAA
ncbi:3-oxoacyl-ACP synthase III family protein [Streptomyces sp. R39]|uniref:3-oxoacyl-ACP synthase III family protein n=1 Tax=Streptomyces sp. R39 TaxID=3238631 RepID=A0AB39QYC5_9ACTN|nr:ketoacyl-ACP synthase III [Streptomyces shenzhenensis]